MSALMEMQRRLISGMNLNLKETKAIFSLTGGDKKSRRTSRVRACVAPSRITNKEFAHLVGRKHFSGHSCTSSYFKVIEIIFIKAPPTFFVSIRPASCAINISSQGRPCARLRPSQYRLTCPRTSIQRSLANHRLRRQARM